ncbi:gephyrin-like molybdotransferase Glp [Actinomyces urogenitalis]|uniref:molybdopterin molybdotransferase MoeA n=1 Tax=Actinomyces urogenitalis TaxID=103621 RepID=UPI00242A55AD|nr:gephyrin-like molybdotransferase Glp [Actinomyces urogenitalis]MCI7456506.1 molybdopterin molybdotransferase MoeA [Actinomyces urogenitalis]
MRTVAEHLAACLDIAQAAAPLDVVLLDAVGCVLAEDVVADLDLPAVDLAGIDGYAVAVADLAGASATNAVTLEVMDAVRAGDMRPTRLVPGTAILIDSGAPLPLGADAVVAWQDTDRGTSRVQVRAQVEAGANVRQRAEDVRAGETVLTEGTRISARHVALAAGLGRHRLKVHPAPRVVIVSIGDEIVEPGAAREPGDVFDANGHALASAVADAGGQAFRVAAVPDELRALSETIEDQLVRADVLITTGGLSVGQGDTVKEVLAPLGSVRFDAVAMSPGRQLGVGTVDGTPIFCLPGDPVSAQIAFETFVRPVLRQIAGRSSLHRSSLPAKVATGWHSPAHQRQFVPVHLSGSPSKGYVAEPTAQPGRARLSGLARANAIAVVPEETRTVVAGDLLHCLLLDA